MEQTRAIVFDTSDGQQLRINMIGSWLKKNYEEFGLESPAKIIKLSIDGGFTCPNRDGSKGVGGCLFCSSSGSGDMASPAENTSNSSNDMEVASHNIDIRRAIESQIELLQNKWPKEKYNLKYIAYFQSHTNTYASVDRLRQMFELALSYPEVIGLAIATRPDCISDEVIKLIAELNKRTFLWVELGLQTIHDRTAKKMNLCHELKDYDNAVTRLYSAGIRIVTHLILGLPGESKAEMLESVRYASSGSKLFGLKLHMLNVVRGSGMEKEYPNYVPFETIEDYVDLLIEAIELIPPGITLHRISGDAPRSTLIAPEWSYKKRNILNLIHQSMRERNTWQGKAIQKL